VRKLYCWRRDTCEEAMLLQERHMFGSYVAGGRTHVRKLSCWRKDTCEEAMLLEEGHM